MTIKTLYLKTPTKTNVYLNGTGGINNLSNTVYGDILVNGGLTIAAPEVEIAKLSLGGGLTILGDENSPIFRVLEGIQSNGQFGIDSRNLSIDSLVHEGHGEILNCSGTIDYLQTTGGVTIDGDVHVKHIIGGGTYTLSGNCVVDLLEVTSGMAVITGNAQVKELRVVRGGLDYSTSHPQPSAIYLENGGGTYTSGNGSSIEVVGGGLTVEFATIGQLKLDGGGLTLSGLNTVDTLQSNYSVSVTPNTQLITTSAVIGSYDEGSEVLPNVVVDPSSQVSIVRQTVLPPEIPAIEHPSYGSQIELS